MKILFLDDDPNRRKYFLSQFPFATTVETAQECIREIHAGDKRWDEVWLDHDLSGQQFCDSDREDCGMEVVRYIERIISEGWKINLPNVERFVVHSLNDYAARSMVDRLRALGYNVDRIPFTLLRSL